MLVVLVELLLPESATLVFFDASVVLPEAIVLPDAFVLVELSVLVVVLVELLLATLSRPTVVAGWKLPLSVLVVCAIAALETSRARVAADAEAISLSFINCLHGMHRRPPEFEAAKGQTRQTAAPPA